MAVMVFAIAMFAMVMVITVVIMIVRRAILRGMIVTFRCMRVTGARIGAAFGIERRLDLDHPRAQPLDHRLDDVIAPDPQAPGNDLRRQMAVAEVPGDPNQVVRIGASDLDQRLRRRDNFDQPVIVEHQRIAAPQRDRVLQIQ